MKPTWILVVTNNAADQLLRITFIQTGQHQLVVKGFVSGKRIENLFFFVSQKNYDFPVDSFGRCKLFYNGSN